MRKTKTLDKNHMLRNIGGLSLGDKAYCGPYGTVKCIRAAVAGKKNTRKFSVSASTKIANGGNYTIRSLRKAIYA